MESLLTIKVHLKRCPTLVSDFLQGLQQIEIYKGASGAIFGPAAIGGAINFVTDIDYENYFSVNGTDSRTNSFDGNFIYISESGWHQ